jgi:hypothetical protein
MPKEGVRFAESGEIWEFRSALGITIQKYLVLEVLKEANRYDCGQYRLLRLDEGFQALIHEVQLCERYAMTGWRFVV